MASDYKFTYQGVDTQSQTNIKTLKLLSYEVGGRVFKDLKQSGIYNGAYDSGEPLLEDVPIFLFDSNGVLIDTVSTAADGTYNFIIKTPGQYKIKVDSSTNQSFTIINAGLQGSKVNAAGEYAFTLDQNTDKQNESIAIGFIDFSTLNIGTFTDRVTGRNSWIKDSDGVSVNQKYNCYFIKNGDEVVTRTILNDKDSIGYDKVTLSYDFNSDNNQEIKVDSPEVVAIREKDDPSQLINYTATVNNPAGMTVTINSMPSGCDIEVYVKYKILMQDPNEKLNNKLLNNKVDVSATVNSTEYSLKEENIKWPINLSDAQIIIQ